MSYWNLPRMPGPLDEWLTFIQRFLQTLNNCKTMSRSQAVQWGLDRHKDVGAQFMLEALHFLTRLDLCGENKKHQWYMKPLGHEFLAAKQPIDQGRIVAKQLMLKFRGVREILEICVQFAGQPLTNLEIDSQLHKYPIERAVRVPERTEWLRICAALESTDKGRLFITPLGLELNDLFPVDHALARASALVRALKRAAFDSDNHEIFEIVVRQCLEFLGFIVKPIGGRSDTDLLITAPLGLRTYCGIVDPKTNIHGQVADWNAVHVAQHKAKHDVPFALVIANNFDRSPARLQDAADKGIVLLTVAVLQKVIEMHADTPMSTSVYKALFETPGLVDAIPAAILTAYEQTKRAVKLLLHVFDTLNEVPLTAPLPKDDLKWLLLGKTNCDYSEQETEHAIQFLAYPALGAIHLDDKQCLDINMDRRTLHNALRQIALQFSEDKHVSATN